MAKAIEPGDGASWDDESALVTHVVLFPNGVRDFVLGRPIEGKFSPLQTSDLLKLNRAARLIERVGEAQPALASVLALCRLLVPCLRARGSDRHLVVEPWSEADLRGNTLAADVPTPLARDLASEQAADWRAITAGTRPPAGSLAALFWDAHTRLPLLPDVFDDPDLGRFAKALYVHLVPQGTGQAEPGERSVKAAVEACWATGFASLGLPLPRRRLRALFRKLLAVTIRYTGQIAGAVARRLVERKLASEKEPLRPAELALLELRYGASRALGDINLGLLSGSGPRMAELIDEYARSLAADANGSEHSAAADQLRAYIGLLASFRGRRRYARAAERREDRQRRGGKVPHGQRLRAEAQPDLSSPDPVTTAMHVEQLDLLRIVLPRLKPRDRERLEALLNCGGDRKAAAAQLGLSLESYSRQLRQTVIPAAQRHLGALRSKRVHES